MSKWLSSALVILALFFGDQVLGQGLSEDEKDEILDAHNYYRGQVDPIATNMLKLEWNEDLAYLAQYRAATCEFRMDDDQVVSSFGFDYVGENAAATYAAGYNTAINYTRLIGQQWFIEKRYFNYYAMACLDDDGNVNENGEFETCGRYTQLVWARTYAVGCGAFTCQELEGAEDANENALFLVCNYGPGGNFASEPPYSTGSAPCESCPYDRKYCTKNLCSESGAIVTGPVSVMGLLVVAVAAFRSALL